MKEMVLAIRSGRALTRRRGWCGGFRLWVGRSWL